MTNFSIAWTSACQMFPSFPSWLCKSGLPWNVNKAEGIKVFGFIMKAGIRTIESSSQI